MPSRPSLPLPPGVKTGDRVPVGKATLIVGPTLRERLNAGDPKAAKAVRKLVEASGGPWWRVVGGDEGRVVVALSLPDKRLSSNGNKGSWKPKHAATAAARDAAAQAVAQAIVCRDAEGCPWDRARLSMAFWFPDLRKRDARNYEASCKAYIDGAIDAGLVIGDEWNHLQSGASVCGVDRADPRVELTFERL